MSHHPERTARNVRPVNQPPSYYYVDDAGTTGDEFDTWDATGWMDIDTFCLCTGKQVPVGQAFWIYSAASAGKFTFDITK